jgi:hypothetical protein
VRVEELVHELRDVTVCRDHTVVHVQHRYASVKAVFTG